MLVTFTSMSGDRSTLHGPGDLAALSTGTVSIRDSDPARPEAARWAVALGLFVLRGGTVAG